MKIYHDSRSSRFRSPFGAVEAGTSVSIAVEVSEADISSVRVTLRLWVDGDGERLVVMSQDPEELGLFSAEVPLDEANIVWYSFIAETDHETVYLGATPGKTGGVGEMSISADPPSFQITVYRPRAVRPSWYEQGIVYQIFPDRYRRDADWLERTEAALAPARSGMGRHIVKDWNEPPVYDRNPDGSIASWDLYGGSLKGIEEDLDRLSDLGVTVIYLNPIFEAVSNHRYDTADYMKIDPVLGDEKDFTDLCREAAQRGISIILDGVFNHTGDDSVYFNRYGNFPGLGAWQSEKSVWRDAYTFHEDGTYDCWWGISNMPATNESSKRFKDLIVGKDGVVRHWLAAGARGWRLDVADELSDSFIREITAAALAERPDALILGEVWEDASNKVSYGQLRRYLLGDELDSAMNYPFRMMVLDFLLGRIGSDEAAEIIESLAENYPPEALSCALNLLGSHDRPRIASVLGGGPDEGALAEEERGRWRLDAGSMGLAKSRFWLASLIQMTFPGVPSIYYGDEFGLEGLSDPGNRRPLPYLKDVHDTDMQTIIKNAAAVRRALPFMTTGTIRAISSGNKDVLAYTRSGDKEAATVLINRSLSSSADLAIPALAPAATEVVGGREVVIGEDGLVHLSLEPMGSAIVHFHEKIRLEKPLASGVGTVCHITSIPNEQGFGTLGEPARRFVDHLADLGLSYWQVLPVNPTDAFNSPYAGPSAFAGNIELVSGGEAELRCSYKTWKGRKAKGRGLSVRGADPAFDQFVAQQAAWLEPYCAYTAIKQAQKGKPWQAWPEQLRSYRPELLDDRRFADEARFVAYGQFCFDQAWHELARYAHERGIALIGDIPMYVSADSVDAWAHPELFHLTETGEPAEIAGVPADDMAPNGQLWGNPTFRWDHMKEDGYTWWIQRLERACDLYDVVRLDHFLGFHSYFSVPAGCTCEQGRWLAGPGVDLFRAAHRALGPLPFIAEDLGLLTPGVRALSSSCGFLGLDVLQFEDYDVRCGVRPRVDKMIYTSTHDTATLIGWCAASFTGGSENDEARELAQSIMASALESKSEVVMIPLQDILGLGEDARMNYPGVAEGNWSWQASEDEIAKARDGFVELMKAADRTKTVSVA
ncbi:4-alpha-glucanotransferase [Collinsella sp. AGMB00827]|uniref:4-alpha-glucanotransferase n=1 Tax=Collinsella ureilytica TaxID=2869515 RepID=A0ABS7MHL0_9ACTN|nr:4-alpha-glucanotransferase [Collinsella urealyticum]MBY4796834.1 4-alpha-glucanotransferase [Collinsella urealyticum]